MAGSLLRGAEGAWAERAGGLACLEWMWAAGDADRRRTSVFLNEPLRGVRPGWVVWETREGTEGPAQRWLQASRGLTHLPLAVVGGRDGAVSPALGEHTVRPDAAVLALRYREAAGLRPRASFPSCLPDADFSRAGSD